MSARTPQTGIWAAIVSAVFANCFSFVALTANFTALILKAWINPLSFAAPLLLAWSYLVLVVHSSGHSLLRTKNIGRI